MEVLLREATSICIDEYSKRMAQLDEGVTKFSTSVTHHQERKCPKLISIKEWEKIHGYPSASGLRHLCFIGKQNGFERCIRRIGRRVLIDEDEYFKWVKDGCRKLAD